MNYFLGKIYLLVTEIQLFFPRNKIRPEPELDKTVLHTCVSAHCVKRLYYVFIIAILDTLSAAAG